MIDGGKPKKYRCPCKKSLDGSCRECNRKRTLRRTDIKARDKAARLRKKTDVVEAYGGKCACCGEKEIVFLTIDHIFGGGQKQRAEVGGWGTKFYKWLKDNQYPKDRFQLLCFNCNFAKGKSGSICPHQLQLKHAE